MKNETARREIESLDYYLQNHTDDYSEESHTAMMMAMKALEQEPCEDAFRRADAEALFRNARSKLNPSDYKTADEFNTRDLMLLNAEQFIHLLPSVRPQEPKTGHWTALEEWKNDFKGFINELSMPKDDYNGIMEYIDEVPNEVRWIPVSERLPEENKTVITSTKYEPQERGEA